MNLERYTLKEANNLESLLRHKHAPRPQLESVYKIPRERWSGRCCAIVSTWLILL